MSSVTYVHLWRLTVQMSRPLLPGGRPRFPFLFLCPLFCKVCPTSCEGIPDFLMGRINSIEVYNAILIFSEYEEKKFTEEVK